MKATQPFRVLLLTYAMWLSDPSRGQNYIPNPSFEDYNGPCDFGVSYEDVVSWVIADCAYDPWYINACNNDGNPYLGVPGNLIGHQQPHSGSAYAALMTYSHDFVGGNIRSYASIDLIEPLVAGQECCIRMMMSLADSSSFTTGQLFGFLWYDLPTTCAGQDSSWDTYAAVTFDISGLNTSNWTLLEGSFAASGGETNLTIGSFLYAGDIDTTFIGEHLPWPFAAYYIDDVYLGSCDVSIENVEQMAYRVYPNPVDHLLQIEFLEPMYYGRLEVRNVQGQTLSEKLISGTLTHLDVSDLASGEYYLRIVQHSREDHVRFTVEH